MVTLRVTCHQYRHIDTHPYTPPLSYSNLVFFFLIFYPFIHSWSVSEPSPLDLVIAVCSRCSYYLLGFIRLAGFCCSVSLIEHACSHVANCFGIYAIGRTDGEWNRPFLRWLGPANCIMRDTPSVHKPRKTITIVIYITNMPYIHVQSV